MATKNKLLDPAGDRLKAIFLLATLKHNSSFRIWIGRSTSPVTWATSSVNRSTFVGPYTFTCARKRQRESRSFLFRALNAEITVHCPGEVAAYRQSKADPTLPIGKAFLQLNERLEDRLVLVGGNAPTGVADP